MPYWLAAADGMRADTEWAAVIMSLNPSARFSGSAPHFYPEGVVARLPTQSANEIPHQVGTNLTPKACSPEASSEIRELASFQWAECLATQALSARRL
jgi:hypothetical protein